MKINQWPSHNSKLFPYVSKAFRDDGYSENTGKEIREVYGMEVVQIPTNRPRKRIDQPDLIFNTQEAKYKYVTAEVKNVMKRSANFNWDNINFTV